MKTSLAGPPFCSKFQGETISFSHFFSSCSRDGRRLTRHRARRSTEVCRDKVPRSGADHNSSVLRLWLHLSSTVSCLPHQALGHVWFALSCIFGLPAYRVSRENLHRQVFPCLSPHGKSRSITLCYHGTKCRVLQALWATFVGPWAL